VLTGDSPASTDWWAAAELIEAGYATGALRRSKGTADHSEVVALSLFRPTIQGRLFADELAEQARKETLRYRLARFALSGISFIGGWVAGVLSDTAKAFILNFLGLAG
jgi:hypothetical protein